MLEPMLESVRGLLNIGQYVSQEQLIEINRILHSSELGAKMMRKDLDVLQSLAFQEMTARYSAIAEAHSNTFEWIFEPSRWPSSDSRSQICFHNWLTHGGGIYWISGKPGSVSNDCYRVLAV